MAGNFLTKRILLVKEVVQGTVPASPVCIEFLSESFDFKQDQASEEINLLGTSGDASPMSFGTSSFSGTVGLVASTDNMPIILTHILGEKVSSANAVADSWTANTTYAVGDIVNTVANTKHSLVCYTAGKTGATEPTLAADPNSDRGSRITDGTAVWLAMPKLLAYSFTRKQQLPSFTIEYQLEDDAGNPFYKRFSNVFMNAMPVAMSGGTISLKVSGDFVGASAADSTEIGFTNLAAMSGAKVVPNFKEFYAYEDCTVTIDGVAECGIESINLDVTRNVTMEGAINGCKIPNVGVTSVKGNINRVFTLEDYADFKNHIDMAVVFDFQKVNGCGTTITFPYVRPKLADAVQAIDKQAYLSTEISGFGAAGVQSVSATCVAPAMYDSTGALVGAY
jgi:hypothetical protein